MIKCSTVCSANRQDETTSPQAVLCRVSHNLNIIICPTTHKATTPLNTMSNSAYKPQCSSAHTRTHILPLLPSLLSLFLLPLQLLPSSLNLLLHLLRLPPAAFAAAFGTTRKNQTTTDELHPLRAPHATCTAFSLPFALLLKMSISTTMDRMSTPTTSGIKGHQAHQCASPACLQLPADPTNTIPRKQT